MDRELIRIECLKLAHSLIGRGDAQVVETAKVYEHYVMGTRPAAEKPADVPSPEKSGKGRLSLKTKDGNPFS